MKRLFAILTLIVVVAGCKKNDPAPTPLPTQNTNTPNNSDIFSIINSSNSALTSNDIQAIFARNGTLYVATSNELAWCVANQWQTIRYSQSTFLNTGVNCITANDSLIFTGTNNGLYKITSNDTILISTGLPLNNIRSVCLSDSVLWVGTASGGGLAKYNLHTGTITATFTPANSNIPNASIGDIACDNSGIWLASAAGFSFFDGNSFINYSKSNSALPNNSIYDIYITGNQKLWLAHNNGISFFNNGSFTNYDMNNSGLVLDLTRCVYEYNSKVYIGTYGQGLDILDLNTLSFSHYSTTNSNISNNYIAGYGLSNNNIYFATQNGINKMSLY